MIEFQEGSQNVFADLGFPDAETHLLKARLVSVISRLIKDQCLTQTAAAERIGMAQPDVSRMLEGQFRSISVEKLLRCILALGSDVSISIERPATTRASDGEPTRQRGALRMTEPASS